MKTFRAVLDALRPLSKLAGEINEPEPNVRSWYRLDSIPPHAYRRLADVATARGIEGVTSESLLAIAEAKRAGAAA